jgi:hypothetical protein
LYVEAVEMTVADFNVHVISTFNSWNVVKLNNTLCHSYAQQVLYHSCMQKRWSWGFRGDDGGTLKKYPGKSCRRIAIPALQLLAVFCIGWMMKICLAVRRLVAAPTAACRTKFIVIETKKKLGKC